MLIVESARGEDLPQVARLAARELREMLPDLGAPSERRKLLVAREVEHNHVVGFALTLNEAPGEGHLVGIAVEREHQGEGIGGALLRRTHQSLRNQGTMRVNLEVRFDDQAARDFYERHGYAPMGLASHMYSDGSDALRLSRPL